MLTPSAVQSARPQAKAYKLHDERGLFLLVTPVGGKLWRFKYRLSDASPVHVFHREPRQRRLTPNRLAPVIQRRGFALQQGRVVEIRAAPLLEFLPGLAHGLRGLEQPHGGQCQYL